MKHVPITRWQTENIVDLIRAEVVISILAVHIMIVDIVATDKEIAPLHTPIQLNGHRGRKKKQCELQ